MKQKELIDLVRKNHPHLGEKEIRTKLNIAQEKICRMTKAMIGTETGTTVADTRAYELSNVIEVDNVYLKDSNGDYRLIPRLVGPHPERE